VVGVRNGKELVILGLLFAIWGLIAYYNTPPIENVQMGWIQISNWVGKAGATIYTDRGDDPNLSPQMRFPKLPEPAKVIDVGSLTAFVNAINESGTEVIYRHGDSLVFVRDSATWVSYTPTFYIGNVPLRP
jgi:hypothetical protein